MTALALPNAKKLWLPKFESWRLLRPLKLEGMFFPYQTTQFVEGNLIPVVGTQPTSLRDFAEIAGLQANLQVCLDPASIDSWPGSGQTLFDISGNNRDFFLGATGSVSTDDPTFNGTAGLLDSSSYFSSDGGDGFKKTTVNDTFFDSLHKAGAAWTIIYIEYYTSAYGPGMCTQAGAFATNSTAIGICTWVTSLRPGFSVGNGSATVGTNVITSGSPMATSTMLLVGLGYRYNSATSRDFIGYVNGTYQNTNYTSPSFTPSASAANQAALGIAGSSFLGSGRRIYGLMMFDKVLSQAEFDALRVQVQRRHAGV